jgi:hypothetical protein
MESETGEAWQAFVTVEKEVVVYCPDCAEREFGDDPPEPLNDASN